MASKHIAAIDMGTNSFHLIIVQVKSDGTFKVVDREREVIRLGSSEGKDLSFISLEEMEHATKIILRFKKLAEYYNANIRAIATSAVREARNKDDFIRSIKELTSIKVEIIDGKHEAELIFAGVNSALELTNKIMLCIDIGGGSTEIILGKNGKPIFTSSIKVGAVRLSKKFFPNYLLTEENIRGCDHLIKDEIIRDQNISFNKKYEIAVGTSGTIQSVASILYYYRNGKRAKILNGFSFTKEELFKIADELLHIKALEDRMKIKGIEEKRGDIIPAGLMILRQIFKLFNIEKLTVSDFALREGIILETITEGSKIIS
jgi:exopolyphosphatase/guanosine-5'-triphosphate,3'-diphosphate pyrophosphatase